MVETSRQLAANKQQTLSLSAPAPLTVIADHDRLWEAIDRQLLCPFEYFAVEDEADFSRIKWTRGRYDPGQRFFSWIYRIAVNEALDIVGRRRREAEFDDSVPVPTVSVTATLPSSRACGSRGSLAA